MIPLWKDIYYFFYFYIISKAERKRYLFFKLDFQGNNQLNKQDNAAYKLIPQHHAQP